MKKLNQILSLFFIISLNGASVFPQLRFIPKALPFRLEQVQLLDSPFKHAMELDAEVLLKISPDRLLHNFRKNA